MVCLGIGLAGAFAVSLAAGWVAVAYLGLQVAYNAGGKHTAVVDVWMIASGFALRVLVGTVGLGIEPTQWLLLCTMLLTLCIGCSKRRAEIGVAEGRCRPALAGYTPGLLDYYVWMTGADAVLAYSCYTMAGETVAIHGGYGLKLTVPWVLLGLGRYLMRYQRVSGDAARALIGDRWLQAACCEWLATALVVMA